LAGDTGGLHDTVVDLNRDSEHGSGITVQHIDTHAISWALDRLYNLYYEKDWGQFVVNSVNSDFSWNASALKYIDLYNKIL
jgi:starch synthase